jgi:type IV secretory pathway TraG/TraD family ATPase VirD4
LLAAIRIDDLKHIEIAMFIVMAFALAQRAHDLGKTLGLLAAIELEKGPSHLLTMAPTRTGKGVGTIIPNLLTLDRSILCIDPKGENAIITAKARDRFGPVHILDPFGVTGLPSSAVNPLGRLDPEHPDAMEDANGLAEALVQEAPGETGEAHWNEEAKALLSGLILQIAAAEPSERRNLSTLREYLTLAPESFAELLKCMQQSPEAHGLIARAANRHLGKAKPIGKRPACSRPRNGTRIFWIARAWGRCSHDLTSPSRI